MVLFLLCIFENQQGNRYLKLMWSHNKIWRINANVKRKKYYKYNDKVWKQIIWVYFVSLPIIQKKLNLSELRLLLRSDWHWNSMATLRQACRRWPLRKLGVSEKSGLFSNCSTENACAVSACAFSSLSKLHQTADQPRGETERDFDNQNSIASVTFGDLQLYSTVINILTYLVIKMLWNWYFWCTRCFWNFKGIHPKECICEKDLENYVNISNAKDTESMTYVFEMTIGACRIQWLRKQACNSLRSWNEMECFQIFDCFSNCAEEWISP